MAVDSEWVTLQSVFPKLNTGNCQITSLSNTRYNCVAWAAGEQSLNWWPTKADGLGLFSYWPISIKAATIANFCKAFGALGYELCGQTDLEPGHEKVAVYADGNYPTHMARQLPDGKWTSKLGKGVDITHDSLELLEGDEYGKVAAVLKRAITQ